LATYKRIKKLAAAGQAEIWIAKNSETSQELVMKRLLPAPQLQNPDAELRRFHREVRCQGSLEHDGIMPIIGWNFSASPPWYIMPRADHSLADVLDEHPDGLEEEEAVAIMLDVAAAVEYAHGEGVLHRDLKPANVLYLDGRWDVADFGLCRDLNTDSTTITKTNAIVGTVAYLAS